ncbi:glycoside hydrolase family 13 protein [Oenococcus sicerae]|uniref:Alpha-glycosidase n=1 Tax=Oenococcus sicerae TaxID=2203724 RepID=A0AAJ1R9E6_9LACO|nr:glycoside hydrolase family 13 protein [Oenococcus sicerae]MDN6900182.1 alpha-glycosidase [Oenococcus sicerae]
MNKAAIYHRPESEFSFLFPDSDHLRIRIRTAINDAIKVELFSSNLIESNDNNWVECPIEMQKITTTPVFDYWVANIKEPIGHLPAYAFRITDRQSKTILYCDQGFVSDNKSGYAIVQQHFFRMPYMHDIDRFQAPEWVKNTIWYQIFPDRFSNGNHANDPEKTLDWQYESPKNDSFYGGDIQGIINKLGYLHQLGINGIYLTPIFKSPSNHKYDTEDYLEIDPNFGSKNDFKNLIDKAHKLGIKIMIDAVFNHIGANSYQWQDVLRNGAASPFANWFHISSFPIHLYHDKEPYPQNDYPQKNYETFANAINMPKWNTANPDVQKFLVQTALYWTQQFQIDGWRLDVANEVDHHFWREFRKAIKFVNPEIFIVGEVWHSSQPWLNGDQFDSVMNYSTTDLIKEYFLLKKIKAVDFIYSFNDRLMLYQDPTNQVMFNLLDSHDSPRIATVANGNFSAVKSALAFMFLQQGTPDIYYGTEYGMIGKSDPDSRRPMVWDKENQNQNMYQFVHTLISIRKKYSQVIEDYSPRWHYADAQEKGLISFEKGHLIAHFSSKNTVLQDSGTILMGNNYQQGKDQIILGEDGFCILER